jgi:hypothetical protein
MSESHAEPDASEPSAAEEAAETAAEEPAAFTNRAARRAKGKTSKPAIFAKGQQPVGRGAVQSPRQYGNRRSG